MFQVAMLIDSSILLGGMLAAVIRFLSAMRPWAISGETFPWFMGVRARRAGFARAVLPKTRLSARADANSATCTRILRLERLQAALDPSRMPFERLKTRRDR